jgi:hypothetical protein
MEDVEYINLPENGESLWALVNTVMNLRVPLYAGKLLTS